jgi:hypothetical protein
MHYFFVVYNLSIKSLQAKEWAKPHVETAKTVLFLFVSGFVTSL